MSPRDKKHLPRRSLGPAALALAVVGAVVVGIALGIGAAWLTGVSETQVAVAVGVDYATSREASSEIEPRPDPRAPSVRLRLKPGTVVDAPALPLPQAPPPQAAAVAPAPVPEVMPAPAWRAHAAGVGLVPGVPMIGIIIDDLGLDHPRTARALSLPAPVTLAFLSYGNRLGAETAAARAAGHELLVHVPMEPERGSADPGPNVLRAADGAAEIRARLDWALNRFGGFVGINNHMGSKFTADAAAMDVVAAELKRRGLLFLDSRTSAETRAFARARAHDVPAASRDIFLDRELAPEAVRAALADLELRARKQGRAIAIGHPHDVTLDALEAWLPTLKAKGLQLVPVSALVETAPPLSAAR